MKGVITKEIYQNEDYQLSSQLVEYIFMKYFNFNYQKVSALSPQFNKVVFNTYRTDTHEILGTIALTWPNAQMMFPSNFYFGFITPDFVDMSTTMEMGRLVKTDDPKHKEYDRYIYISLLLAVKAFSQAMGISRWVASVHNSLLANIQNLGIPVEIIAPAPLKMDPAIRESMGTYPNNTNFITATMEDSFRALEKFQHLINHGIIKVEINVPALV